MYYLYTYTENEEDIYDIDILIIEKFESLDDVIDYFLYMEKELTITLNLHSEFIFDFDIEGIFLDDEKGFNFYSKHHKINEL